MGIPTVRKHVRRVCTLHYGVLHSETMTENCRIFGGPPDVRILQGRRAEMMNPLPHVVVGAGDGLGQAVINFGGLK